MTVADETPTRDDLIEALTHRSAAPPSPARTRWCDPLLDRLLELRHGAESVR